MNPDNLEKMVSAPAQVLDSTVQASKQFAQKVGGQRPFKSANKFWKNLGPGLTTGAADDDPSGIATYSQTGAQYGLGLLWLAGFTFPLMAIIQEMCARLGMVSGRGLAGNIRKYYPRKVLYLITLLLFIANTVNIGANLGAMAKASQLLFPNMSFVVLIIFFTVISLALQIYSTYEKYAKYLKYLALILVSYVISGFLVGLPLVDLFKNTVFPSIVFNREQIILICAI
ncbi:MAG: Nramp family divalent metal transporter, partial [Microgenomates group bacterium]